MDRAATGDPGPESLRKGPEWLHELKYDGYRMLCRIKDGPATSYSPETATTGPRSCPDVAAAAADLRINSAWLDGEVVALLPDGRVSFQRLQNAFDAQTDSHLVYVVFDLLYLDGYDLRPIPLIERKRLLSALLRDNSRPR